MKITKKKKMSESGITDIVNRLTQLKEDVCFTMLDREREVTMIINAMICRQHVLLEGPPGVAKSEMTREIFKRISGAKVFDKMFAPSTVPDEVFGPTLIEEYKKGVWKHNTEGFLPTSDYANLEELGRASDSLLPNLMSLLNERIFHNGPVPQKCDLRSAIATANSLSTATDLAAFYDRWLLRIPVNTLSKAEDIVSLLKSPAKREVPTQFVSLEEMDMLYSAVCDMEVDPEVYSVIAETVVNFRADSNVKKTEHYLSDRRVRWSMMYLKADALMSGVNVLDGSNIAKLDPIYAMNNASASASLTTIISLVGASSSSRTIIRKKLTAAVVIMRRLSESVAAASSSNGGILSNAKKDLTTLKDGVRALDLANAGTAIREEAEELVTDIDSVLAEIEIKEQTR